MVELFKVLSPGVGLSVQDFGRPGWRRYGVSPAGAMDPVSMEVANRLVGNLRNTSVLQVQLQGARLKCLQSCWVALAGADLAKAFPAWTARRVEAGEVLAFSGGETGVWAYLAVPGGFHGDPYFGSVSVDERSGMGQLLRRGSVISAGSEAFTRTFDGAVRRLALIEDRRKFKATESFELLRGPQFEDFSSLDCSKLVKTTCQISTQSDATGYRLEGLTLAYSNSIYSEPVMPGSFQVTTDGRVIVTLAYGPTVGGYGKIAILQEKDLARFAQCRPGTKIKLRWKVPS